MYREIRRSIEEKCVSTHFCEMMVRKDGVRQVMALKFYIELSNGRRSALHCVTGVYGCDKDVYSEVPPLGGIEISEMTCQDVLLIYIPKSC